MLLDMGVAQLQVLIKKRPVDGLTGSCQEGHTGITKASKGKNPQAKPKETPQTASAFILDVRSSGTKGASSVVPSGKTGYVRTTVPEKNFCTPAGVSSRRAPEGSMPRQIP